MLTRIQGPTGNGNNRLGARNEVFFLTSTAATLRHGQYPASASSRMTAKKPRPLKNAGAALYRAKKGRRRPYQFYTADMHARASKQFALKQVYAGDKIRRAAAPLPALRRR